MTAAPSTSDEQHRSPLHDRHVTLGAKLADFGGWEMPIEYPDGGVLKEHAGVREHERLLHRVPIPLPRGAPGRGRRLGELLRHLRPNPVLGGLVRRLTSPLRE